jgi:ABC-2 type transport system ATP-binding protein
MISIESLTKKYRNQSVVYIAQLTISPGECFGVVGNNGAGKTTLFRMIVDLIRPTEGSVRINGTNVQGNDEWKGYVGSFLDENFLISYLNPEEYFEFIGGLHHYSGEDLRLFYQKFETFVQGQSKKSRDCCRLHGQSTDYHPR